MLAPAVQGAASRCRARPLELLAGERPRRAAGAAAATCWRCPTTRRSATATRSARARIVAAIKAGCKSASTALGESTQAGTGCGTCQPLLTQLLDGARRQGQAPRARTRSSCMKEEKDGLDALRRHPAPGRRQQLAGDDRGRQAARQVARPVLPQADAGQLHAARCASNAGQTNARQFRVIADLSDEFGKGFCDLTTRQQIQLRWFTLADVPEIWRRLEEVGLHSKQTGMDNVRGVCGCPRRRPDAARAARRHAGHRRVQRADPRQPRVHQPAAQVQRHHHRLPGELLPRRDAGHRPGAGLPRAGRPAGQRLQRARRRQARLRRLSAGARRSTCSCGREDAAALCAEITRIFRDHGCRGQREPRPAGVPDRGSRHRLVPRRAGAPLGPAAARRPAPTCARSTTSITSASTRRRRRTATGRTLYYVGLLVPVGRITTAQMRGVADLAERYGNGDVRVTVQQNLIIPNIPEDAHRRADARSRSSRSCRSTRRRSCAAWWPARASTTATWR